MDDLPTAIFFAFVGLIIGIPIGVNIADWFDYAQNDSIMMNHIEAKSSDPIDGWGNPLRFMQNDLMFVVGSAGRDGEWDTRDDISVSAP